MVNPPQSEYIKLVGGNIKRLRVTSRLNQDVLSERAGIFRTYLSRIESGTANPSLSVLLAIAGALEIEPNQLFE